MYIDRIVVKNLRSFRSVTVSLLHPESDFGKLRLPKPAYPNINLVLGDNGMGKTTLLRAIALAALGPAVQSAGLYSYRMVRREASPRRGRPRSAHIVATFTPHAQDGVRGRSSLTSKVGVVRRTDLEEYRWQQRTDRRWQPIFSDKSHAFFSVGYGATRRVEKREQFDESSRKSSSFARALRVRGLFEEAHSLVPLASWLPSQNAGRTAQVRKIINQMLGKAQYQFTGKMESGEYLFENDGLLVPFPALSDGYRAFLGWVGDLLFHVCATCPPGVKLDQNRGIVMVDEIDLHLHPQWQMHVLPILAKALPRIQFIVTSHSPLIVGSLEWMNVIAARPGKKNTATAGRLEVPIHGLDADQVLITEFFGLQTTRTDERHGRIKALALRAGKGNRKAAQDLLQAMSRGQEAVG